MVEIGDAVIHKPLFILAHVVGNRSFYTQYRNLLKSQWHHYDQLRFEQEKQLRILLAYSYEQVPYYRKLFTRLNLRPSDIRSIEDLEKLPVLTKEIIKNNWHDLKPVNLASLDYDSRATGGSTGTPMEYRVSQYDRFLAAGLLYRGWGYGGYNLGDSMVFLAGSSLDVGTKPWLVKRVHEITRNVRKLSSFDMSDTEMRQFTKIISSFQPRFIRGYASSIYFFARWLKENDLSIPHLYGVFTTAELLLPQMRKTIGEVFACGVYDNYGLNDGGVTAFECSEHAGMHVDTERSIMEVIDEHGHQVEGKQGQILATSLYNYAMPFIRYETGDLVTLTDTECSCGRHAKILRDVVGRSVDFFVTPEGKNVHGWFFLLIFWDHGQGIREYQLIQTAIDQIVIKFVPDKDFDGSRLETIRKIIRSKSSGWNVEFREVDAIDRTSAGKYKFIINELMA